jgi:hypothetical protein
MIALFGTALACLFLTIASLSKWHQPGTHLSVTIAQSKNPILITDMKKAYEVAAIALLQNLSFHLFQFYVVYCIILISCVPQLMEPTY